MKAMPAWLLLSVCWCWRSPPSAADAVPHNVPPPCRHRRPATLTDGDLVRRGALREILRRPVRPPTTGDSPPRGLSTTDPPGSSKKSCPATCDPGLCSCVDLRGEPAHCAPEIRRVCLASGVGACVPPRFVNYFATFYCPYADCVVGGGSMEACGCEFYQRYCETYGDDNNVGYCDVAGCCAGQASDAGRSACMVEGSVDAKEMVEVSQGTGRPAASPTGGPTGAPMGTPTGWPSRAPASSPTTPPIAEEESRVPDNFNWSAEQPMSLVMHNMELGLPMRESATELAELPYDWAEEMQLSLLLAEHTAIDDAAPWGPGESPATTSSREGEEEPLLGSAMIEGLGSMSLAATDAPSSNPDEYFDWADLPPSDPPLGLSAMSMMVNFGRTTLRPDESPARKPTAAPSGSPTRKPTTAPSESPARGPALSESPTDAPTEFTPSPSRLPASGPSGGGAESPAPAAPSLNQNEFTIAPADGPRKSSKAAKTKSPTAAPTKVLSEAPTGVPTEGLAEAESLTQSPVTLTEMPAGAPPDQNDSHGTGSVPTSEPPADPPVTAMPTRGPTWGPPTDAPATTQPPPTKAPKKTAKTGSPTGGSTGRPTTKSSATPPPAATQDPGLPTPTTQNPTVPINQVEVALPVPSTPAPTASPTGSFPPSLPTVILVETDIQLGLENISSAMDAEAVGVFEGTCDAFLGKMWADATPPIYDVECEVAGQQLLLVGRRLDRPTSHVASLASSSRGDSLRGGGRRLTERGLQVAAGGPSLLVNVNVKGKVDRTNSVMEASDISFDDLTYGTFAAHSAGFANQLKADGREAVIEDFEGMTNVYSIKPSDDNGEHGKGGENPDNISKNPGGGGKSDNNGKKMDGRIIAVIALCGIAVLGLFAAIYNHVDHRNRHHYDRYQHDGIAGGSSSDSPEVIDMYKESLHEMSPERNGGPPRPPTLDTSAAEADAFAGICGSGAPDEVGGSGDSQQENLTYMYSLEDAISLHSNRSGTPRQSPSLTDQMEQQMTQWIGGEPVSTRDRIRMDILAPPGKLGIIIDTCSEGPIVHSVKRTSPLEGLMFKGDLITAVDDEDTREWSAHYLTKLVAKKSKFERKITVSRVEVPINREVSNRVVVNIMDGENSYGGGEIHSIPQAMNGANPVLNSAVTNIMNSGDSNYDDGGEIHSIPDATYTDNPVSNSVVSNIVNSGDSNYDCLGEIHSIPDATYSVNPVSNSVASKMMNSGDSNDNGKAGIRQVSDVMNGINQVSNSPFSNITNSGNSNGDSVMYSVSDSINGSDSNEDGGGGDGRPQLKNVS